MSINVSRLVSSLVLATFSIAIALLAGPAASAQEADAKADSSRRESVDIEPYTGPPIYLPKVTTPPPPTEVESRVVKEKFPESDNLRFERRIVKYSDNSVLSDGANKEYYSNGQLYVSGTFDRGKAIGKWTYYHDNGTVAKEVTYKEGKPDGPISIFNEEGTLVAKREYTLGRRSGTWETYSEDGKQQLRLENYKAGKANGEFKVWFANGELRQQMSFVDGKREGLAKEWNSAGEKRAEVNYSDGKKDGQATVWGRDGKATEQVYKDDRLIPNAG